MTNLEIITTSDKLLTTDLSTLSGAQLTFAIISNIEILSAEAKLIRKTIKQTEASNKYNEELNKLSIKHNANFNNNGYYTFENKEDATAMDLAKQELDKFSEEALLDIAKIKSDFEEVLNLENTALTDKLITVKLSDIDNSITAVQMSVIKFMIKS